MAASDQFVEQTTSAAVEEKAKLQKHFSRFDIYFFLICTLVGVDTLGAVAANGAAGLHLAAVPGSLLLRPVRAADRGAGRRVHRGGRRLHLDRMAFGRFTAAINAVLYWLSNPIWLGGTLAILRRRDSRATSSLPTGSSEVRRSPWPSSGSRSARRSCRSESASGSPRSAPWCRILVLGLFTVTMIVYAIKHGLHLPGGGDFSPTCCVHRRWCRCCSSTTWASSCPTPPAMR